MAIVEMSSTGAGNAVYCFSEFLDTRSIIARLPEKLKKDSAYVLAEEHTGTGAVETVPPEGNSGRKAAKTADDCTLRIHLKYKHIRA